MNTASRPDRLLVVALVLGLVVISAINATAFVAMLENQAAILDALSPDQPEQRP